MKLNKTYRKGKKYWKFNRNNYYLIMSSIFYFALMFYVLIFEFILMQQVFSTTFLQVSPLGCETFLRVVPLQPNDYFCILPLKHFSALVDFPPPQLTRSESDRNFLKANNF